MQAKYSGGPLGSVLSMRVLHSLCEQSVRFYLSAIDAATSVVGVVLLLAASLN